MTQKTQKSRTAASATRRTSKRTNGSRAASAEAPDRGDAVHDVTATGKRTQRGTGASFIYQQLRDEILSLALQPGSPLDEVRLSKRFKLSRSPVREAIIRLASEGLVTIFPNRSSMVAPLDVGLIPHYLDALELMQRATTRLAAQNRTNGDLERIRKAEAIFADAVNQRQLQEMINGNYDYHIAIAQAGGNPYFTALYSRLLNEGKRMLHMHFSFATESKARGVDTLLLEHAAITRAIEEQDFELAERLAYVHSVEFRKRFTQYLERNATQDIRLGEQAYAKPPVKNTRTRRAALGRRD